MAALGIIPSLPHVWKLGWPSSRDWSGPAQETGVAQLNRPNPTPPRDGSKATCIGPMMTTGTWRQTADCSHAGGTQAVVLVNASDLGW